MNDDFPVIDDVELERLADGELSPSALRDLVSRLDRVDDGWKRAALAMFEAQALRSACRATLTASATIRPVPVVSSSSHRLARELVTIAGGVLLTCGLGW